MPKSSDGAKHIQKFDTADNLWTVSEDVKVLSSMLCLYIGENSVEVQTEADDVNVTECPGDDQPSTGTGEFHLSFFWCIIWILC